MADERYYHPTGPALGLSRVELAALSPALQIDYARAWFVRYFEDPAQETPYNGREGGYLFIHGGPYSAASVLFREFSDLLPESVIQQAVDQVEEDGIHQWAPTIRHPDRIDEEQEYVERGYFEEGEAPPSLEDLLQQVSRAGVVPVFGSVADRKGREGILERLEKLESLIAAVAPQFGEIGHNRPPGTITREQLAEVKNEILEIRAQLANPTPDVVAVAKSGSLIERIWKWLKERINGAIDTIVTLGLGAAAVHGNDLISAAGDVVSAITSWLLDVL